VTYRRKWSAWSGAALLTLFIVSHGLAQDLKPGGFQGGAGKVGLDTSRLRKQVDSLERANGTLSNQVAQLEIRVNRLLSQEGQRTRQTASDWNQFRTDVLKVMEPKIGSLQSDIARIAAMERAYNRHIHEYTASRGGWANLATLQNCPECLIKFSSDSKPGARLKTSEAK